MGMDSSNAGRHLNSIQIAGQARNDGKDEGRHLNSNGVATHCFAKRSRNDGRDGHACASQFSNPQILKSPN